MAAKKKVIATVAAVATSAALLLGGTLAWQSTNQTALNEASDVINPGGRLHDDFNGENKDVYVENFADENIYARIRLEEYFEIITNYGNKEGAEKPHELIGSKTTNEETGKVEYIYDLFTDYDSIDQDGVVAAASHTDENSGETTSYWSWQTGGSTVYMPTFNVNKDSLLADVNGVFNGAVGNITDKDGNQYSAEGNSKLPYVDYSLDENRTKIANELYDGDANDIDEFTDGGNGNVELADIIANGDTSAYYENYESSIELVANQEHTAADTLDAELISMAEWLGMVEYDENGDLANLEDLGNYWVYDEDGWVYWSAPIEPDSATGLLLDGIELNQVMDDTWYYAINVIAQFVTADDVGKSDNTGFYDTNDDYPEPSADAEKLLKLIGVEYNAELTDFAISYVDSSNTNFAEGYPWLKEGATTLQLKATIKENGSEVEIDPSQVTWSVSGGYTGEDYWYGSYTVSAEMLADQPGVISVTNTSTEMPYEGVPFTVTATYGGFTATKAVVYCLNHSLATYASLNDPRLTYGWYYEATVNEYYQFTSQFYFNGDNINKDATVYETEWHVTDADGNETTGAVIDENGIFVATVPGKYKVSAQVAGYEKTKGYFDTYNYDQIFTVEDTIVNQLANKTAAGSTASGGTGIDVYNNGADLETIYIDGEKYFVLTRDESVAGQEKALVIGLGDYGFYLGENENFAYNYSTGSNVWADSDIYKLLNSADDTINLTTGDYDWEENASERTYVPYLVSNPTVASLAIETPIKTRVYSDQDNYTYATTNCKVFTISEADLFGTVGNQTANAEDYTLVKDGQGIKLFDCAVGGEYKGSNLCSYGDYWLRSTYAYDSVGRLCFHGFLQEANPKNADVYDNCQYNSDSRYSDYWGYIVPMFWADISSADRFAE